MNIEGGFNPYTDPGMVAGPSREGFNAVNAYNGSEQKISHSASHSAGSYEPLLASFYQSHPNEAAQPPTPPPRNPQRIIEKSPIIPAAAVAEQRSSAGSTYSISSGDERLDPDLRRRMNEDANSFKGDLRDDEDYSRPVLGVCFVFTFFSPRSNSSLRRSEIFQMTPVCFHTDENAWQTRCMYI